MASKKYAHEMGDDVQVSIAAKVVARSEYKTAENRYLIRVEMIDGATEEIWVGESALK